MNRNKLNDQKNIAWKYIAPKVPACDISFYH